MVTSFYQRSANYVSFYPLFNLRNLSYPILHHTHNAYCKIVIRHASFDAARMLSARWKREIFLEYLTEEKFVPLYTAAGTGKSKVEKL